MRKTPMAKLKPASNQSTLAVKGAAEPHFEQEVASSLEHAFELRLEQIAVADEPVMVPPPPTVVPPPPGTAMVTPYEPPLSRYVTQAS
jgi:hypothetical protein